MAYNTLYQKYKGGKIMFTYNCGYAASQLQWQSPRKASWELVLILFIVLVMLGFVFCAI